MDRKEIIQNLRNRRYTFQQIGDYLGISRQATHQILNYVSKLRYRSSLTQEKIEGRDFLKELVRQQDNWTCQICGKVWQRGQRRLDVHHLDENLEGKNGLKYKNCKNFDKMITLCHKCHLNLESVRNKMGRKQKVENFA